MAIYGRPMHLPERPSKETPGMKCLRTSLRFARAAVTCLGFAMVTACSTTMSFGSAPQVDRLQALRTGSSTASEVRNALGEPRGRGQARFAVDVPEQQIWFYEYMQSDGRKVQLKMLLVFMDGDVYGGHIWFSSGQLLGGTQ